MTIKPEDRTPHRGSALCGIPEIQIEGNVGSVVMTIPPEWCDGHFPQKPIAPGHWIGEAALVVAGILTNQLCDLRQPIFLKKWSVEYVGQNGGAKPGETIKIVASLSDPQPDLRPGERQVEVLVTKGSEPLFFVSGIGFSPAIAKHDLRNGKRRLK